MKIVKIICDRCGKEIEGNPYMFYVNEIGRDSGDITDSVTIEKDFCQLCTASIMQDITDATVLEPEPEPEPVATETTQTTQTTTQTTAPTTETTETTHKPGRKTWINKEDGEEIMRRYRAGEDMLKIADDLNLLRPQVSRFIADGKLGRERYKGKIPSNGGAPIPMCSVGSSISGQF